MFKSDSNIKQNAGFTMADKVYAESYLEYQRNRSWLRKTIRKIYLWNVRRHVAGNVLDFGCGVGEHLSTFSNDSMGLEINESTVAYCKTQKLNVELYRPEQDDYRLLQIESGKFQTLVISHVLEHLESPDQVLAKLFEACKRLGIRRVLVVVPCEVGYNHDKTHVTFITRDYMREKKIEGIGNFYLLKWGYFPFNMKWVGRIFVYNELYFVYESV